MQKCIGIILFDLIGLRVPSMNALTFYVKELLNPLSTHDAMGFDCFLSSVKIYFLTTEK